MKGNWRKGKEREEKIKKDKKWKEEEKEGKGMEENRKKW